MERGLINTDNLITYRYDFEDAVKAYEHLNESDALGIVLSYKNDQNINHESKLVIDKNNKIKSNDHKVSFIGGGNYASRVLIPLFRKKSALHTLVTNNGINSTHQGKKNRFLYASSNIEDLIQDESNIGVIATQHNLHAFQTIFLLNHNKNVFVEKPLALKNKELNDIREALDKSNCDLMVGYNRRFALKLKKSKTYLNLK